MLSRPANTPRTRDITPLISVNACVAETRNVSTGVLPRKLRSAEFLAKFYEVYKNELQQNKVLEPEPIPSRLAELEKENLFLHKIIEDNQKTIDAHEKTIEWLEHLVNNSDKKLASAIAVKKN